MGTDTPQVNHRELMKKVEQAVEAIDRAGDVGEIVHRAADLVIERFRDELGLYGGRLYQKQGKHYRLLQTFGDAKEVPEGLRVPRAYEPVHVLLDRGVVYMKDDDPRFDPLIEEKIGVETFAAIEVGDKSFLLAFNVAPGHHRDDVLFSLGILRHSINQRIRQERMENVFQEARKIQASILPRRPPAFGDFDIFGRNVPMESVGGDFFDYIELTDKILGLAIADVSGHGLPAALQTRDIYMGLRMGLGRDYKIVRTVERLNEIIHGSTLTSRFVSLFYGELELSGAFIYVNAGHPPPCHLKADGTVQGLTEGGTVLGPISDAAYERGFVKIEPGDLLLLSTDGIAETLGPGASGRLEEYGGERLLDIAREMRGRATSEEIVDAVFKDVARFSGKRPQNDDRTLMVIQHRA